MLHTYTHTVQLQKQLVDDRIESVVLRVDEFKKQLETMNENLTSSSEKMQELHEKMRMLKELFKRIDQVEVRLNFFVKVSLILGKHLNVVLNGSPFIGIAFWRSESLPPYSVGARALRVFNLEIYTKFVNCQIKTLPKFPTIYMVLYFRFLYKYVYIMS